MCHCQGMNAIEANKALVAAIPNVKTRDLLIVKDTEFKNSHEFYTSAPCEWSEERGATHTLYCGAGLGKGTRPAKLLKTVAYVGIDENADGEIVWEKWSVTPYIYFPASIR